MKMTDEKIKGRGGAITPKGRAGREEITHFSFLFWKGMQYLGCLPRSACLTSLA